MYLNTHGAAHVVWGVRGTKSKQYRSMQSTMWCLSVDGMVVVHHCCGGGSHHQPQPGCCLIPRLLHYPYVMEVE
jgi:hypothetical protein